MRSIRLLPGDGPRPDAAHPGGGCPPFRRPLQWVRGHRVTAVDSNPGGPHETGERFWIESGAEGPVHAFDPESIQSLAVVAQAFHRAPRSPG